MTPITFRGYRLGAPYVTVIGEHITYWYSYNAGGIDATRIVEEGDMELIVAESHEEVEKKVKAALNLPPQAYQALGATLRVCDFSNTVCSMNCRAAPCKRKEAANENQ